jgi:hypothetical protein
MGSSKKVVQRVNLTHFYGASGVGFFSPEALYDMRLLNGQRGPLTTRGVPPMRVVPAFDGAEDREAGLGMRGKAMFREALDFACGEAALRIGN